MSAPQNPQNPNPYADPVQEHVPGQGAWTEDQQGQAGGQRSAYGGYPQGSGYPPGGGYASAAPRSYLQGAPVGFADAVRGAFGHPLTLRGRASRSAFWWFQLLAVIAYAVVSVISDRSTVAGIILDIVIGVPMLVANISLAVTAAARLESHRLVVVARPRAAGRLDHQLVFYLLPSTPGPNRYSAVR